jgi:CRP-like cAMP-binding protein/Fe-S-cluster-containing hydrogenase component 2
VTATVFPGAPLARRQPSKVAAVSPEALAAHWLFSGVPEKAREKTIEKLAKYFEWAEYEEGDLILEAGSYGDTAYYIEKGAVEVLTRPQGGGHPQPPQVRGGAHEGARRGPAAEEKRMLGRGTARSTLILSALPADPAAGRRIVLEAGELFGEISALSRYTVSADVVALTRSRLIRIQLRGLRTLMQVSKPFKKFIDDRYRQRTLAVHLKQVPLFSDLEDALVQHLKDKVELLSFEPGAVIVQEGAAADGLYLVRGGYVKVGVRAGNANLAVTYLARGDHAGEASLLLEQPWPFTLQALEHVELVKLAKADFEDFLARHPERRAKLWAQALARLKERGAVSDDPTSAEHMQTAMDTGLIHGESVLLIDLLTCTHCDECVRGCADAHDGVPRFVREGERLGTWLIPTACYQCTDPVCMIDCPTGAITRETGSLVVTINPPEHPTRGCIGCNGCVERCPWGNIVNVPVDPPHGPRRVDRRATKCDLCHARPEGPACVQMCPHGSAVRMSFRDVGSVMATLRR